MSYEARNFYGTVILKDWVEGLDGNMYKALTGRVSIVKDEELVGFKSEGNNNANWVARIEGRLQAYNILGCQIRGAIAHEDSPGPASHNRLVVP